MEIKDYIGKLDGFSIEERTEVCELDCEGKLIARVLGVFKKEEVAKAYCSQQTDSSYFKTFKILVLTNGTDVFSLEKAERLRVFVDEEVVLSIRKSILAKLTEDERRVIGI